MKMAKASQADLDIAMRLISALESLSDGSMPGNGDDAEWFDSANKVDCTKAINIVLKIFETGALFRVVFGMYTLLDPDNRVVNPDSDTLELHPYIDRVQKQHNELHRDAMRYRYLRGRDLDTIGCGGVFAGMTPANVVLAGDDLDAEIDAAMTLNVEPNETER